MELIYIYIKKFGDFIFEQGIQLSKDFEVELKDKELRISKKQNPLKNYYGCRIQNVSVMVGKNGSGKTTILDILGMTRQDRLRNSIVRNQVRDEYFLLYYLGKDDDGDELFGIEIMGENVLHNMFVNYHNEDDDERYDKSKASIGKVYKYKDNNWISTGKHFFDYEIEECKLSELIRYTYIGERYRYSNRNEKNRGYFATDGGYIAERVFNSTPSVYKKYLTLVDCISGKIKGFECDKGRIRFWDDIDSRIFNIDDEFEKYENMVNDVEKELLIWNKINILGTTDEKSNKMGKKDNYILDLYSRYIIDMLVNGLYNACKSNRELEGDKESVAVEEHIEYIKNLGTHSSSEKKFGKPSDFEVEISRIKKLIAKLKLDLGDKQEYSFVRILAKYIGSRIHSVNEEGEFGYVAALEDLVEGLLNIPEEYFNKHGVEIIVKGERIASIEKLLKFFSQYYSNIDNGLHSDVGNKFKVSFDLLSEGEERFLDIITKLNDSIVQNEGVGLLVLLLDEPDQSLHPEWSRRFIDIILQVVGSIDFSGNIQLVISTHSPYLLSDILPEDVFLLERDVQSRKLNITQLNKGSSCLGANIYDLMKNDFFMNNTVGEFATKKINSYMKRISEMNANTVDIPEIEYFVQQIGEPIIQKFMLKQIEEKKLKLRMLNNGEGILQMITNEKDRERVKAYLQTIKD